MLEQLIQLSNTILRAKRVFYTDAQNPLVYEYTCVSMSLYICVCLGSIYLYIKN